MLHALTITATEVKDAPINEHLSRTRRPFGGLIRDIKCRYSLYWSDIKDGIALQSISTIIFLYLATLTQVVTIGGLMGKRTQTWIEMCHYNPKIFTVFSFLAVYLCHCKW